jgi:hypothetical protein
MSPSPGAPILKTMTARAIVPSIDSAVDTARMTHAGTTAAEG